MSEDASLDPRPIGWFAVATADDLARGREHTGILCDSPYRLRRHGDGALDATGLGPLVEQNGLVLAWFHPAGAAPSWHVPALDETGWRAPRHVLLQARTHPQEVYENSIDVAHFPVIHKYRDIRVLEPMQLVGHEMRVRYQITRGRAAMTAQFEVHLHGIGCAHNSIEVPSLGLRVRMLALTTPTEPGHADIRLAISVARDPALPLRPMLPLVHAGITREIVNDFRQDMSIWEHKRHLRPPMLVKGDGPIELFRRWSRQFSLAGS